MKWISFLLSLLLTIGTVYFLNSSHKISSLPNEIPPLGKLFNPFTGFWQNAETSALAENQLLDFPTLKEEVNIVYDDRMVPHIFAQNDADLAFAHGYVMAQHRLWQMDFLSRFAGGRLAEVLGKKLLANDQLQRRRGMVWAAQKTVDAWKKHPEEYKNLKAFTTGVNAYTASLSPANYPIEFKILNYEPENWTPVKSALVIKYMAQNLASRETDLEATNALKLYGQKTFDFLYPEWNPKQDPIIPKGTKYEWETELETSQKTPTLSEVMDFLKHQPYPKPAEHLGSNNWAVSGAKTKNGHPILSSDPHLQLTLPSIWFESQLHTPEMNAYGVCIPGFPGVVIGFNEDIAWGQTNVGQDVLDWYRIKWADQEKTTYWLDGKKQPVKYVYERIGIRWNQQPLIDTVKYTYWGPIVYEADSLPKHDLAMQWVAHDPGNGQEAATILELNKAKNYEDYSKALMKYEVPAQNFVFAARDGDIALKVNGKFPVKKDQQGRFVQEGDQTANDWKGWIPMTQVPQIKNPERNYVSSANQHSTDPSYPYYYNGGFADYRGRVANRFLDSLQQTTIKDMMAMQNSNYSIFAEELLPLLLNYLDIASLTTEQQALVNRLKNWNYHFDKGQLAPALFTVWWNQFYRMTWDEIYTASESMPLLFPENWRTIALLEEIPESDFFDDKRTAEKETAADIITRSFLKMTEQLEDKLSQTDFNWSKQKGTIVQHLGRIPAFSRNVDNGGYRYALNAISRIHGPSWRMVIELGDRVQGYGVFPGGQSGNPGSPYYDDSVDEWTEGKYHELFFMKDQTDRSQPVLFTQQLGARK